MTWGRCRRLPAPPQIYVPDGYLSGGGDLSDNFGRLSISPYTTNRHSRSHCMLQRSDGQLFQQWMSGDADSKTVLRQLGYGSGGDTVLRRKPSSLPASESKSKGDAPLVDLHIHITDNNIGTLSFGPPTPEAPQRNM